MSIYLKWFWRYKRSKLKVPKKILLSKFKSFNFYLTWGIYSYNTSFESPNQWPLRIRKITVWQHFYLVLHPLEKSHFTLYKGIGCLYFLRHCRLPIYEATQVSWFLGWLNDNIKIEWMTVCNKLQSYYQVITETDKLNVIQTLEVPIFSRAKNVP